MNKQKKRWIFMIPVAFLTLALGVAVWIAAPALTESNPFTKKSAAKADLSNLQLSPCTHDMDKVDCDFHLFAQELREIIFREWHYDETEKQNLFVRFSLDGDAEGSHIFVTVRDDKTFLRDVFVWELTKSASFHVERAEWLPRDELIEIAIEGVRADQPIRQADLRRLASQETQ